jgi:hypothetical protein
MFFFKIEIFIYLCSIKKSAKIIKNRFKIFII